jgi:hypothetical protein
MFGLWLFLKIALNGASVSNNQKNKRDKCDAAYLTGN